jgi:hypothetical protein
LSFRAKYISIIPPSKETSPKGKTQNKISPKLSMLFDLDTSSRMIKIADHSLNKNSEKSNISAGPHGTEEVD